MNILSFIKYVNRDSLTKEQLKLVDYAAGMELFYTDSPNKEPFVCSYSELGFFYHHLPRVVKDQKQQNCSFNVAPEYARYPERYSKQSRPRRDKTVLYEEFFSNLEDRGVVKKNLPITLSKFVSTWTIFLSRTPTDSFGFWGMAKGTPRYNRMMKSRIIDTSSYLQDTYKYCYIISPTVDPKEEKGDLQDTWVNFNEKLGILCKELSREFDAKLVVAVESQRNLNPHAHILMFTNQEFKDIKHRYSRSGKHLYISGGKLRDKVRAIWGNSIADIQECGKGRAKWYLAKYVAKETETDFANLTKEEKWTIHDVKDVATCLLPMLFGIRQFRLPKCKKEMEEWQSEKNVIMSCAERKNSPARLATPLAKDSVSEIDRRAVVLDCIRNKSPLPCIKNLCVANYSQIKDLLGGSLKEWNEKEDKNLETILPKCKSQGCSKCAFGMYLTQLLGGESGMLKQWSIFDIFGAEITNLYKDYCKASPNDRKFFSTLRDEGTQKAFLFNQMPQEWSFEEKENVFLLIEHLDSCFWQFVLSPKYAEWARIVHLQKSAVRFDNLFDKEIDMPPETLLKFFPLTYSASGVMILKNEKKEQMRNE